MREASIPARAEVDVFVDLKSHVWVVQSVRCTGSLNDRVCLNAGTPEWEAGLMYVPRNEDGRYGPPRKWVFLCDEGVDGFSERDGTEPVEYLRGSPRSPILSS